MKLCNGKKSVRAAHVHIEIVVAWKKFLFLFMLGTLFGVQALASPGSFLLSSPAHATFDSRQQSAVKVTSAAWGAVAQGRNQTTTRAPYLLMWSVTSGTAYNYFELRNVGTTALHAMKVLITQVRVSGSNKPNEIFFERCLGGSWNSATHSCSGTIVEVGRASQGQFQLTGLDLPITSFIDMRARTQPNSQNIFDTTLDVHISRGDFRNAEVRNS